MGRGSASTTVMMIAESNCWSWSRRLTAASRRGRSRPASGTKEWLSGTARRVDSPSRGGASRRSRRTPPRRCRNASRGSRRAPRRGDFGPVITRRNQPKRRDGGAPDERAPPPEFSHYLLGALGEGRKNNGSRSGTFRPALRDARPKRAASPPGPKARRVAESALRARPAMNVGRVRTSGARPRRSITGSSRG